MADASEKMINENTAQLTIKILKTNFIFSALLILASFQAIVMDLQPKFILLDYRSICVFINHVIDLQEALSPLN
jgi:hypothetical protein